MKRRSRDLIAEYLGGLDVRRARRFMNSGAGGAAAASGYKISRSLRFNGADSASLTRTPGSAGNRKTWTLNLWTKRAKLGDTYEPIIVSPDGSGNTGLLFDVNNKLAFNNSGNVFLTTRVFRDVGAWYHIVLRIDTTQATAADRVRLYVNGIQETAFDIYSAPSQNADLALNNTSLHRLFGSTFLPGYFDGYGAEMHFVDGQSLGPESFGKTDPVTGMWVPIRYTGTYGTNGFYLDFSDNSNTTSGTLGKDRSGNNNDWTPNNLSVTAGVGNDSLTDTPTNYADGGNGRGNYCTLSVVELNGNNSILNGGLDITTGTTSPRVAAATHTMRGGKWYWEITNQAATPNHYAGIFNSSASRTLWPGQDANGYSLRFQNGNKVNNDGTGTGAAYGSAVGNNAVVMCALDLDNGKIWWGVDGTWIASGDPVAGTNAAYTGISTAMAWAIGHGNDGGSDLASYNFGQRAFAHTPPTGFKALNTQNLSTPVIKKPGVGFDVRLRTGTGAVANSTGWAFQPDLLVIKRRDGLGNHNIFDSTRGVQKGVVFNTTAAEYTNANTLTAFNSDGFTLGSDAGALNVNVSGQTHFDMAWKKGAAYGLDIVGWTGNGSARSISHGLGVVPELLITHRLDSATNNNGWTWTTGLSGTEYIYTSGTVGKQSTDGTMWNSAIPTSSVFSVGTYTGINASGGSYVAWLFASIPGFSIIRTYVGNASADGPFVWCGFRPKWLVIKRIDSTGHWYQFNAASSPYNVIALETYWTTNNGEVANVNIDFLSNGFKIRRNLADLNASGGTYMVMAFAEFPEKFARAR